MSQNVYMLPFVKKKFSNLQETFQNIFEDGYRSTNKTKQQMVQESRLLAKRRNQMKKLTCLVHLPNEKQKTSEMGPEVESFVGVLKGTEQAG